MYDCKMCKKTFEGEPARSNGVGLFCAECNRKIIDLSLRTHAMRRAEGTCLWCGDELTESNTYGRNLLSDNKSSERVCRECESGRSWLLACIKYSDRPARYTASKEKKYVSIRKENAKHNKSAEICSDDLRELERLVLAVNASFEKIKGRASK